MIVCLLTVLAAGCATGQRPRFSDDSFGIGQRTGDPAVDAVLTGLDSVTASPHTFTATYDILTKYGEAPHSATVTVDGARRAVTVDRVRYLDIPDGSQTCVAEACSTGLNPAAISDTQLTIDFYATSAATRLRVDANAKIGPSTARAETVAGRPATCVDVAQSNNTATYCALADGPLAELDDADVRVTMTSYQPVADPQAFVPSATPPAP